MKRDIQSIGSSLLASKVSPAPRLAVDLRSCPNCHGVDVVTRRVARAGAIRYSHDELYQAACVSCGVRGPEVGSRGEAQTKWNQMVGPRS